MDEGINQRYYRMAYFQFIGHKLINMFTVSLSKVFMQKNPVTYSQTAVYAIYKQEYEPCNISRLSDQCTYSKQKYKRDPDTTHISGKTFCLTY